MKIPELRLVRSAAACAATILLAAAAQAADPNAARYYEDARARFDQRDYKGAVIQLKNALQLDKSLIQVHLLLGQALLADGQVVAAQTALEEALQRGVNRAELVVPLAESMIQQGKQEDILRDARFSIPGLPLRTAATLLLLRAGAAADLGDARQAMADIDEARRLEPGSAASWVAEVPVRIRAGQLAEALAAADRALMLTPGDVEALHVRAQVAHAAGRLTDALGWYDKAIAARADHLEVRIARAGLRLDLGRVDDAGADAEAALKISPTDPRANYLRALVAERAGRAAAARDAYNQVTGLLDPVPPEFLRYRPQLLILGGLSHYSLRQNEKALPYLDRVQRLQPGSAVAKVLARIHLQMGNAARASEVLDAYLRQSPRDAQAVLLLASIHMAQGRFSRAALLTQELLKSSDAPAAHALAGLSLMGAGQFAEAAAELEGALKQDAGNAAVGSALVALYLQSGQVDKALLVASGLVKARPRSAELQMLLGQAQAAGGQATAARASYQKALTLQPGLAAATIGLARLDAATGQLEPARRVLDAAVRADGKNLEAMAALAEIEEAAGRLPAAQQLLERIDDVSGAGNVATSLALVDFHLRHGAADAAREALKRATAKSPEALATLLASVRVSLAVGDTTLARSTASRASAVAGYDVGALQRVALLQMQAGHPEGAAHTLDKALQQRPGDRLASVLRAEAAIRTGDLPLADRIAADLLRAAPRLGVGHALRGDIALARGRPAEAIDHFRRAYQVEASTDNLLRLQALVSAQDPTDALGLLRAHVRKNPKDRLARRALADAEARGGNFAAARTGYEELVRSNPQDAEALNNLAQVMLVQRDPAALATAERALKAQPSAAHILGTAGWAAHHAGQAERALQLLRDARLRSPENAVTRYYLGVVLAQAGRAGEAREELRAALALDPDFSDAADARRRLETLK